MEKTAYCGLYCEDCIPGDWRIYDAVEKVLSVLDEVGMDRYAVLKADKSPVLAQYPQAVAVLQEILKLQCSGSCRQGPASVLGRTADCAVRTCAIEKGYEGCWDCTEHDICDKLSGLKRFHPGLARRLDTIAAVGVDVWAEKRGPHYPWSKEKE